MRVRCIRTSEWSRMFSHADRFPTGPAARQGSRNTPRPWGLSRMEPYGCLTEVHQFAVGLDPDTQTARYMGPDGEVVTAKHRKTNTGTEKPTRTSRGDGASPGRETDEDHSQDSDQD